jgi:hypothetical protein
MRRTGLGFSSWFPVVSRGDALGDLPDVQAAGLSPEPQGRAAHGVLISIALLAVGGIRLGDNIDATATGCQSDTMARNVPLLSVLLGRPTPACVRIGVGWVNRLIRVGLLRPVAISSGFAAGFMGLLGHVDGLIVRPDIVSTACSHRICSVGRHLDCALKRRASQTPDLRVYFST